MNQSRSASSAMRALQNRTNTLESENASLKSGSTHLHSKVEALQEQVKFLNAQLEFSEAERTRKDDQHEIDRQNWILKAQHLKHSNDDGSKVEELMRLTKEIQEKHKNEVQILQASLQEELDRVKAENKELIRQNSQYQEICESQMKKLKGVKNKPKLKRNPSRERRVRASRSNSKDKKAKRSLSSSRNSSLSKIDKKVPSYLNKKPPVPRKIEELEKEIGELSGSYKKLLANAGDGSNFTVLRKKIDEISKQLNKKNEELYSLKKKHQETLKKANH